MLERKWNATNIEAWLKKNSHKLDYPESYIGDEPGLLKKDWDKSSPRILIAGGVGYHLLEGNLAAPIMTQCINRLDDNALAHRYFFPSSKWDWELFSKENIPAFSLEDRRPAWEYDCIAFSNSFVYTDINALYTLKDCGWPLLAKERWETDAPLVIRGGQSQSSCGAVTPFYDLNFSGEGEDAILEFIDYLRSAKKRGLGKREMCIEMIRDLQWWKKGWYCAALYEEEYVTEGELKGHVKGWKALIEGIPTEAPFAYARFVDPNASYNYEDPILNYLNPSMSAGEVMISRGCSSSCGFCNEGYINRPYREIAPEKVTRVIQKNLKKSGAVSPTLSALCSSSYTKRKTLLKGLLENVTHEIDFMSQRVDESADDPDFVNMTALSGNRGISLGVEGVSERMRAFVSKFCRHENLIKASRWYFMAGYTKLKLFMIGNLPGEGKADHDECVEWVTAVCKLRDEIRPTATVLLSFCPLVIMPHTPFQWLAAPLDKRSLTELLPRLRAAGAKTRVGSGGDRENIFMEQILHMGDRRVGTALKEMIENNRIAYFGEIPRGCREKMENSLLSQGIEAAWYIREKKYEDVLPWDILSFYGDKKILWESYQKSLLTLRAYDRNAPQIKFQTPKCGDSCFACAACDSSLMHFIKKNEEPDIKAAEVRVKRDQDTVQCVNVKMRIDRTHRYLSDEVIKHVVRRWLQDLPLIKTKTKALGTEGYRDWVHGVEYVQQPLYDVVNQSVLDQYRGAEQSGMKIEDIAIGPPATKVAYKTFYGMRAWGSAHSMHELQDWMAQVMDCKPVEIPLEYTMEEGREIFIKNPAVVKVKIMLQRGEVETKLVDARPMLFEAWGGKGELLLAANPELPIYSLIQKLTGTFIRESRGIFVERINVIQQDAGALFSQKCDCGGPMDRDLLGKSVGLSCMACQIEDRISMGPVLEEQVLVATT